MALSNTSPVSVWFQSLIGILVNCNNNPICDRYKCRLVSIPNRDFGKLQFSFGSISTITRLFQSLIGILVNCNLEHSRAIAEKYVSIPNRDFGKLQSDRFEASVKDRSVSIPNRDFGKLQLPPTSSLNSSHQFQSLIGILVNCNVSAMDKATKCPMAVFQSLIGILVNCNSCIWIVFCCLANVSIPNRDFGKLQSEVYVICIDT